MVEGGGSKMFIQTKTWVYKYGEESKALLQKIAELCVEYLALQVQSWRTSMYPNTVSILYSNLSTDDPGLRFMGW